MFANRYGDDMTSEREIMMPVSEASAEKLIEVHVMRQFSDQLKLQTMAIEKIGDRVQDAIERLIKLENNRVEEAVDRLSANVDHLSTRVDALEAERDKRAGGVALVTLIGKLWPLLAAIGAAVGAYFAGKSA